MVAATASRVVLAAACAATLGALVKACDEILDTEIPVPDFILGTLVLSIVVLALCAVYLTPIFMHFIVLLFLTMLVADLFLYLHGRSVPQQQLTRNVDNRVFAGLCALFALFWGALTLADPSVNRAWSEPWLLPGLAAVAAATLYDNFRVNEEDSAAKRRMRAGLLWLLTITALVALYAIFSTTPHHHRILSFYATAASCGAGYLLAWFFAKRRLQDTLLKGQQ